MARVLPDSDTAIGGPFIPVNSRVGRNNKLQQQLYRISNGLDRLSGLSQSMAKIPLALPIHDYRLTSTFGARMDPFKKRISFHAGVDFGTANGTPVYATLPGTVVRSGYKGPYGLMVEIDHDNGFRTRYGHLARSRVRNASALTFSSILPMRVIADAPLARICIMKSGMTARCVTQWHCWMPEKKFSMLPKQLLCRINIQSFLS